MPEIFFARSPISPAHLVGTDAASLEAFLRINGLSERTVIQPDRAITLASRSTVATSDPRLFVADANDAGRMGSFSRALNNTGRLAVVVDAGLRANKIYTTHEGGGDWMRESAIQMVGFGAGGAAGGLTGKIVVGGGALLAAQAGLLVAGPVGWAVLGVVVGAGLLAGFAVGSYADKEGQGLAASIWDR